MSNIDFQERQEKEKSYLFYKTMHCTCCDSDIKFRTIKSGRLRIEGSDLDMRQHYYGVDANKYHVVSCPKCGYTALERYFGEPMPALYMKLIKESLAGFTPTEGDPEIITYRQAFDRYRMALQVASAKGQGAKASEMGYICLKAAWLLRGEREELIECGQPEKGNALFPIEDRFLKNAFEQFQKAISTEDYPMAGMDEPTFNYLIAALAVGQKEYSTAMKLLSSVITSFAASTRLKDKARELKESLVEQKKVEEVN